MWVKGWQTTQGVKRMNNSSQAPKSKAKLNLILGSCALAGLTVAGITLSSAASASTSAPTPTPTASIPAPMPSGKPWHSNTDPAHEVAETAAQKAAEAAADASGIAPDGHKWGRGGGDHAKKSAAHESNETADTETSDATESPTSSDSPSTSS
jgi:hypothetical protein